MESELSDFLFGPSQVEDSSNASTEKVVSRPFMNLYYATGRSEEVTNLKVSRVLRTTDLRPLMVGTKWWMKDGGQQSGNFEDVDWSKNTEMHGYKDKGPNYAILAKVMDKSDYKQSAKYDKKMKIRSNRDATMLKFLIKKRKSKK